MNDELDTPTESEIDLDDRLRERILRGTLEAERLPKEVSRHHPVFRYGYSLFNEWGRLYDPVLDEWHLESGGSRPRWPDDADFAVCLTHDLDAVAAKSFAQPLRKGVLRAKQRFRARDREGPMVTNAGVVGGATGLAGGLIRAARNAIHTGDDPVQQFERWLNVETDIGARSTFFVPPHASNEPHVSDPVYRYDDRVVFDGETMTVAEMLRRIADRGFEIGLHPSWYAYDDANALSRQKRRLEDAIERDVVSVRQHWLHYDIRKTPAAHDEAGFHYDSTLAVTGNVGFRFGTSYPWTLYDLEHEYDLDVLEVPLIAQDTALFDRKHMGLDERQAFRYVKMLADAVESVGGVLTLNWHPDLSLPDDRWQLYERTLSHLNDRNTWFGTVREVGEWWREHHHGLHR